MRVAIIGSTGQLGRDLMQVFGGEAIGLSHQDFDVTDSLSVTSVIQSLQPDWVINTAAFHRVDDCESNPALAFAVNVLGAANVARAAAGVKAGVVFFSTDYVFSGILYERGHPHTESDPPEPPNVYGVSKWAGEKLVRQANPRHLIVRSAGLYGVVTSRKGWTFPELIIQKARSGETLRVVSDQVTSPTFTYDLADKVKELIDHNLAGLFHVTNSGECSWFEFACATLEMTGIGASIVPINTAQAGRRAPRPPYSAMTSVRLLKGGLLPLRPWQRALKAYLELKTGPQRTTL